MKHGIEQLVPLAILLSFIGGMANALVFHRTKKSVGVQFISWVCLLLSLTVNISMWRYLGHHKPLEYFFGGWPAPWGITFYVDRFAVAFCTLVSTLSLLSWTYSFHKQPALHRSLFFILQMSLYGMILTQDFFNFYVFLEVCSICLYGLLSDPNEPRSYLSVFRYLAVNTVAASLYLIGLAFVYSQCGSLNMSDLVSLIDLEDLPNKIGIGLMVVGFSIKTALFPLHFWLIDTYGNSKAQNTGFIASIVTKVFCIFLLRIFYSMLGHGEEALKLLSYLGILAWVSIALAPLLASKQKDLRKILAYSSISQIGYIIVGLAEGSSLGLYAAILQIFHHAVVKLTLFFVADEMNSQWGSYDVLHMANLPKHSKLITLACCMALLSLIGIPPLPGFFVKWMLIQSAMTQGHWVVIAIIAIGAMTSLLYTLRMIEIMFFPHTPWTESSSSKPHWNVYAPIAVALVLLMLQVGLLNQLLSWSQLTRYQP
ncbi:MAG: proton-conducting transporter membrane subunit [Bdellovibrionota bacterium]